MFLGLIGLTVAFDSLWLIVLLVPFYLVIRYGVVAREEANCTTKLMSVSTDAQTITVHVPFKFRKRAGGSWW